MTVKPILVLTSAAHIVKPILDILIPNLNLFPFFKVYYEIRGFIYIFKMLTLEINEFRNTASIN